MTTMQLEMSRFPQLKFIHNKYMNHRKVMQEKTSFPLIYILYIYNDLLIQLQVKAGLFY